jgi:N-acetylneuraminic acid mutarotase
MIRPRSSAWLVLTVALFARHASAGTITLEDRVTAQSAIERVYWQHRLWPKDNPQRKPSIDAVMSRSDIEARVIAYLKESNALDVVWHRPITREQLQAELDRMTRDSKDPKLLQELFDALHNDADLIAETLARPILAGRLIRSWQAGENSGESFDAWWRKRAPEFSTVVDLAAHGLTLGGLSSSLCTNDTWRPTKSDLPDGRFSPYAVWTGSEMIVWGGGTEYGGVGLQTGGRYNPATDTWAPTSLTNVPAFPSYGTVVWTGTEMIVWGGYDRTFPNRLNRGARYNPTTDTWTATSTGPNVPDRRAFHTAVWTGTEMIVWGGVTSTLANLSTGGRYNPVTDTWTPTSTGVNVPGGRESHTAVWTGSEMLIWGGGWGSAFNDGARYNPSSDTWSPISTGTNVPAPRQEHAAVWSGTEMIVWGGHDSSSLNSGGRYDPASDSWRATSTGSGVPGSSNHAVAIWSGSKMIVWWGPASPAAYDPAIDSWATLAPSPSGARFWNSAVWTGSEMIIWGGGLSTNSRPFNTGARYNPASDSWVATSRGGAPAERQQHSSVWTGAEMIVWGGLSATFVDSSAVNSGGVYTAATDSWVPTSVGPGAPSARYQQAAVWTGREMIIWGGRGAAGPLSSGARYNPGSDAWTPTSNGANVPSPQERPLAVWTGTMMIVFGDATYRGARYRPSTDSWLPTSVGPATPTVKPNRAAVWTGSEMLVYAGGDSGGIETPGGRYDPLTDSWASFPSGFDVLGSRVEFSTVWTGTEMIVWGGGGSVSNTGARFNPLTNAWTPTSTGANVPTKRLEHTALWTGSEMLIWGGASLTSSVLTNVGGRYDPSTDTWTPLSAHAYTPASKTFHTAVWTGSQMIVWGGDPSTATGGLYCACPNGRLVYRDADGDGYGDRAITRPSCDGSVPAGYASEGLDCDDAHASAHPGASETCDGLDNDCDGLVDESAAAVDADGDGVHDLCDDCGLRFDPAQSDFDHDGEGDACDLNDGEIFVYGTDDKSRIEWQAESGPLGWNVYVGDLTTLRSTGNYTQGKICGILETSASDPSVPAAGEVRFSLVTGVSGGLEGSLGTNHLGVERPNTNPCP